MRKKRNKNFSQNKIIKNDNTEKERFIIHQTHPYTKESSCTKRKNIQQPLQAWEEFGKWIEKI